MRLKTILIFFATFFSVAAPLLAQTPSRAPQRFNPDISLNGLFAAALFSDANHLQSGAHDPVERGFTLQNLELTMTSVVDPYFRAEGHLIFAFHDGESVVEVEEAFMTTLGLPYGLQVMGGQFFTRFGRANPLHPHAWAFADQTLINTLMFGGEGLRNLGVQLSALLPFPFYLEVVGSVQNAKGETASSFLSSPEHGHEDEDEEGATFAGRPITEQVVNEADDLLYMGRVKTAFDLGGTVSAVAGTSHLFGHNGTGPDAKTRIHGLDFFMKWKPLRTDHGWPFVTLQGEVMQRVYEAGAVNVAGTTPLPAETFKTKGFYLQTLYGFTRRWVAGLRYGQADATEPNDPRTGDRRRISPNLTFYPSEFSKLRLQYNYDDSDDRPDPVHALFLQFEFSIGAHAAHTF
ncbi:MAG: zinc-regulated TonB-dependent outer membrane receptor [Nitrospiria bacterium]